MKCGHCGRSDGNVTVEHVWQCSQGGTYRPADEYNKRGAGVPKPVRTAVSLAAAEAMEIDITGVYARQGTYFKVQMGSGSGRCYAKKWDVEDGVWLYSGRGPLYEIRCDEKITAEQAGAWGQVTGQCINCGKALTDERSMFVGYGPTCAENNGWPWGEVAGTTCDNPEAEHPGFPCNHAGVSADAE